MAKLKIPPEAFPVSPFLQAGSVSFHTSYMSPGSSFVGQNNTLAEVLKSADISIELSDNELDILTTKLMDRIRDKALEEMIKNSPYIEERQV